MPPYAIQLLNDLHDHFPAILYNPERFQNVQDILFYIRQVANVNPYINARDAYRRYNSPIVLFPSGPYSSYGPYTSAGLAGVTGSAGPSGVTGSAGPSNSSIDSISSLINSVLNEMISANGSNVISVNASVAEDFLERVPIRPTQEQISTATTLHISDGSHEDICTICQDDIEINQLYRRITECGHYFHKSCIDTWFTSNTICPTCRYDIRGQI